MTQKRVVESALSGYEVRSEWEPAKLELEGRFEGERKKKGKSTGRGRTIGFFTNERVRT